MTTTKPPPTYSSKIQKKTHGLFERWQIRQLMINGENISYAKIDSKKVSMIPVATINDVWIDDLNGYVFYIKTNWGYIYSFKTLNIKETKKWISLITNSIKYSNDLRKKLSSCETITETITETMAETINVVKSVSPDSEPKSPSTLDSDTDSDDSSIKTIQSPPKIRWTTKLINALTTDERDALTEERIKPCLDSLPTERSFDDTIGCCKSLIDILAEILGELKTQPEVVNHQLGFFIALITRLTHDLLTISSMSNLLTLMILFETFNKLIKRYKSEATQIDDLMNEAIDKYMVTIKTNTQKFMTNIIESAISKKETIVNSSGRIETRDSHDFANIISTNYNIVKDHPSTLLKLTVLSSIFSYTTLFVCELLMGLINLKEMKILEYQYGCSIVNDIGFLLDVVEHFESIVSKIKIDEYDFTTIENDIDRSKRQIIDAGVQISKIIQILIIDNKVDFTQVFKKWTHNNSLKTICDDIYVTVYDFDLQTILTLHYFELVMEFLMVYVVESYVMALFKLLRSSSKFVFDTSEISKLNEEVKYIQIMFNKFLSETTVGLIIRLLTIVAKIISFDTDDIIFAFETELNEFPNHIYLVYLLIVELIKHHLGINKKIIKDIIISLNTSVKNFITKNPVLYTSQKMYIDDKPDYQNQMCEKMMTIVLLDKLYPDGKINYIGFFNGLDIDFTVDVSVSSDKIESKYSMASFLGETKTQDDDADSPSPILKRQSIRRRDIDKKKKVRFLDD